MFQFQALGIVSGNDYSKNQPGFGIHTNKKELKKLEKEETTEKYIESYAHAIKESYAHATEMDPGNYQAAFSIFVERKEVGLNKEMQTAYNKSKEEMANKRQAALVKFNIIKDKIAQDKAGSKTYFLKHEDRRADLMKRLDFSKKWADNPFRSLGLKNSPRYSFRKLDLNKPLQENEEPVNSEINKSSQQKGNMNNDKKKKNYKKNNKKKKENKKVANVATNRDAIKEMVQQHIIDNGGQVQAAQQARESDRTRRKKWLKKYELKTWKIGKNFISL